MTSRRTELASRRATLVSRAAAQREQVAGLVQRLQGPLTMADKGIAAVRFVRNHPLPLAVVGAVAAFLVARRGGGLLAWGGKLVAVLQAAHGARAWWLKGRG